MSNHWLCNNTYNMPTKNRRKIKIVALIVSADKLALISANVAHKRITFFRPHVSAKKPQKCELTTIPKKAIDDISPCSVVVIFKSHEAYGITKAMLMFSMVAPINAIPESATMRMLKRPLPAICIASSSVNCLVPSLSVFPRVSPVFEREKIWGIKFCVISWKKSDLREWFDGNSCWCYTFPSFHVVFNTYQHRDYSFFRNHLIFMRNWLE